MFRSPLPVILLSLAFGGPAVARDITGSVSYKERIALPPGAELLVVASSTFGTPVEQRLSPEGQVPLAFALSTDDTMALTLHAAVFSGGVQVWVSDPVDVPEGDGAVDLGLIDLHRHVSLGYVGRMICGDTPVDVGAAGDTLRLRAAGRQIELSADTAASGARFGDGAGNAFWSKGNRATLTLDGADLPECLPVIATTLPITARGNEPGWVVTLTHQGLNYLGQDGMTRDTALPPASPTPGGTVFDSGDGLALTLTEALCRDDMTGMPHPFQASVALDGQTLSGCAGDPASLLSGPWRLVDLPGATLPDGAEVTFEARAGSIFGNGGCNRYTGGLDLSGEGVSLTPGGMTMMACEEPLMQLEAAFADRLARVGGFDIDKAGRLVLIVDGAPGAIFER